MKKELRACNSDNIFVYHDIDNFCDGREILFSGMSFDLPFDDLGFLFTKDNVNFYLTEITQITPTRIVIVERFTKIGSGAFIELTVDTLEFGIDYEITKISFPVPSGKQISEGFLSETVTSVLSRLYVLVNKLKSKQAMFGKVEKIYKLSKKNYKATSITYISDKKYLSSKGDYKDIEWTHSFSVCGHWRKISAVGKDRSGEYCVAGFTWVSPAVKNKHLEFKDKIRVIK